MRSTEGYRATSKIDVWDKEGDLYLELWVDADRAGLEDRRPTGGWVLVLKREHGASCSLDWGSRMQNAVVGSSGEAEAVVLRDALQKVVAVSRGLWAAALCAVDVLEQLRERRVGQRVLAYATTNKTAAEKGTRSRAKYLSKTQHVDLLWLRSDGGGVKLEKIGSAENVADLLSKPPTADLRHKIGTQRTVIELAKNWSVRPVDQRFATNTLFGSR